MKIALISINSHTKTLNFASMLHSYAFQQFLSKNGIDSTIIEYKPIYFGSFNVRHPYEYYKKHPRKDPETQKKYLEKWGGKMYELRETRFDKFKNFEEKYYVKTDKCYNHKLLDSEDPGFDCYICVTDVIWKRNRVTGFDKGLFLASDTMRGKKKIAYAGSRGGVPYSADDEIKFLTWISDFDYISVRERSLQQYIRSEARIQVPQVVDPVFLMPKQFYENLAEKPENAPKGKFVLIYLAMTNNPTLVRAAVEFGKRHHLEVIELSEDLSNEELVPDYPHKVVYDIGVEEWLWYMLHAEFFFTNSFHGCCFSIIFEKQFFAGERGGDKIDSLLEMFDLNNYRLRSYEELLQADQLPEIDYKAVEKKKKEYIQKSERFILDAIHDLEKREHRPLVINPNPLVQRVKHRKKRQLFLKKGKSLISQPWKKIKSKMKSNG